MLIFKTIVLVLVIFTSCVSSGILLFIDEIPQLVKQPAADAIDEIPEVPEGGYDPAGGVRA